MKIKNRHILYHTNVNYFSTIAVNRKKEHINCKINISLRGWFSKLIFKSNYCFYFDMSPVIDKRITQCKLRILSVGENTVLPSLILVRF